MKSVRFYLPAEITIQDTILDIRRKIHLSRDTSLGMFRRFQNHSNQCKVMSQVLRSKVLIDTPLREQGILPGDILLVLPVSR